MGWSVLQIHQQLGWQAAPKRRSTPWAQNLIAQPREIRRQDRSCHEHPPSGR